MPLDIQVSKIKVDHPLKKLDEASAPEWLDKAVAELGQTSTTRTITNVARRGLQIVNRTSASNSNTLLAVNHLETFADVISFINLFPSIKTVWTESKRKTFSKDPVKAASEKKIRDMTIASAALGIILGPLSFVKILDRFGAFKLSDLAKQMGNFSVASGGFAVFPFGSFISVLEIAQAGLDIAIAAEKIKQIHIKIARTKMKNHSWSGPLTEEGIENRITHLKTVKMKDIEEEAKEHAVNAQALSEKVTELQKKAEKLKVKKTALASSPWKKIHKLHTNQKIKRLEKKKLRLIRAQHAECDGVEKNKAAYGKMEQKITQWEKIKNVVSSGSLTEPIKMQLEQLKTKKIEKWGVKKENLKLEKRKEGLTISHRVVAIIALLASIIISATGIGIVAILITMTSLALFVALSGLGVRLYNKYKKGMEVSPVPLPQLGG